MASSTPFLCIVEGGTSTTAVGAQKVLLSGRLSSEEWWPKVREPIDSQEAAAATYLTPMKEAQGNSLRSELRPDGDDDKAKGPDADAKPAAAPSLTLRKRPAACSSKTALIRSSPVAKPKGPLKRPAAALAQRDDAEEIESSVDELETPLAHGPRKRPTAALPIKKSRKAAALPSECLIKPDAKPGSQMTARCKLIQHQRQERSCFKPLTLTLRARRKPSTGRNPPHKGAQTASSKIRPEQYYLRFMKPDHVSQNEARKLFLRPDPSSARWQGAQPARLMMAAAGPEPGWGLLRPAPGGSGSNPKVDRLLQ